MNSSSRPQLHFLNRGTRYAEPSLSPRINLLPREAFEGSPEILEKYDRFVTLRDSITEHQKAEGRARRAATDARTEYGVKIREALAVGADVSKIKSSEDKHNTTANAHHDIVRQATGEQMRAGRDLAHAIAEHAPSLLAPSEKRLTDAAGDMEAALDALTRAWGTYEVAWQERRILGSAGLFGGVVQNFDPNPAFPAPVVESLNTLRDHLGDLDRLKSDENHIRTERPNGVQQ